MPTIGGQNELFLKPSTNTAIWDEKHSINWRKKPIPIPPYYLLIPNIGETTPCRVEIAPGTKHRNYINEGESHMFNNANGGALVANNQMGGFAMAPANNQMMNTRAYTQTTKQAGLTAYQDQCQFALTAMAVNHTALIHGMIDQAAVFSPAAEPHMRSLADNYVNSAQDRLSGWYR